MEVWVELRWPEGFLETRGIEGSEEDVRDSISLWEKQGKELVRILDSSGNDITERFGR